jgi:dihydroneopterin aldolase
MGLIALEGMRFYAYHGFYEEEQLIGAHYVVDIYIETNFAGASQKDDLGQTVNYETVYRITKLEMQKSAKLLEAVGQRIVNKIKTLFDNIQSLRLRIYKKNPPMGANIDHAYIEIQENYVTKCDKCGKNYLSHFPGDGWTKYGKVYPETQATLSRTFGRNICGSCIKPYLIPERPQD